MEFFKQWCFCVCVTLVLAVIFSLFTPRGSMKRFYKILISVFIFTSFLYPFKDFGAKQLKLSNPLSEITTDTAQSPYNLLVQSEIQKALKNAGYNSCNVTAKTSVDYKSGEISIVEVTISIPDGYDKDKIQSAVFDKTGIKARVIYVGE